MSDWFPSISYGRYSALWLCGACGGVSGVVQFCPQADWSSCENIHSEGVRRIVLEVLDMTMAGCSHTMSCGSLNTSLLAELDIHQLVEDNCEMTSVCGERIILVLADMVMCLTGACEDEEDQFPDWARPATCAAIAVTVLVFFSIMYFGKSCSESRVKVRNSVPV